MFLVKVYKIVFIVLFEFVEFKGKLLLHFDFYRILLIDPLDL